MSRKDYVAIAQMFHDTLRNLNGSSSDFFKVIDLVMTFVKYAEQNNKSFKRDRFYRACGMDSYAQN
jgi:hypothetical protein